MSSEKLSGASNGTIVYDDPGGDTTSAGDNTPSTVPQPGAVVDATLAEADAKEDGGKANASVSATKASPCAPAESVESKGGSSTGLRNQGPEDASPREAEAGPSAAASLPPSSPPRTDDAQQASDDDTVAAAAAAPAAGSDEGAPPWTRRVLKMGSKMWSSHASTRTSSPSPVHRPRLDAAAVKMWNVPVTSSPRHGHPGFRLLALCLLCVPWVAVIWALTPLMASAADYAVAPPAGREAYLHVGVGPGGTTLCRTRMYATPVARPAGTPHTLSRPWHPVSFRLLYALVAKELWASGEDDAVDRVHFELTAAATGGGAGGDPASPAHLTEESGRWAWVERGAWASVSVSWYSVFTGTLLNPRTLNLVVSVGDADDCPPPSSASDAANGNAPSSGSSGGGGVGGNGTTVEWRRSITGAYLVELSQTFLTEGRRREEGLTGLVVRQPHEQQESGVDELLLEESVRLGTAELRPVWWYQDFRLAAVLLGTVFAGAGAAAVAMWGISGVWARFRCRLARRLQTRLELLRRDRCVPLSDGNYVLYVPMHEQGKKGNFMSSASKIILVRSIATSAFVLIGMMRFRRLVQKRRMQRGWRSGSGRERPPSFTGRTSSNRVAPVPHDGREEDGGGHEGLHDLADDDDFDEGRWAAFYVQDIFGNIVALHSVVHHDGSMLDVHRALLGLTYACTPVSKGEQWRVRLLRKARGVHDNGGDTAADAQDLDAQEREAEKEAEKERQRRHGEQSSVIHDKITTGEAGEGKGGEGEDGIKGAETRAAAQRRGANQSRLDKRFTSAKHKAEERAARHDKMEHFVETVMWGLEVTTAAVADVRQAVSVEELQSTLGPCGYNYDDDSTLDLWSVAGSERMLGPFYLIEMAAQAVVNALPNQLAQSSQARNIIDQISSCMIPYCKLQILSSKDKEEEDEEGGDDGAAGETRVEVEMSRRAKAAAADVVDSQLASVTSVMEGLSRRLRATLADSAFARRADAHLDAMVSMPETVGMTEEQKQALARVWVMGVDGANDESGARIMQSKIQRYSTLLGTMKRRAKGRVGDAWRHWRTVHARITAVVAAIILLPIAVVMPLALLLHRIELNADFDGKSGGISFWIIPIAFACLHVCTLAAESYLHFTRFAPRSHLAIEAAYGIRRACLVLFVIELALIIGTAATVTMWLGIAALVRPEVAGPYVAMIFGPLLILLRTAADQQSLRKEILSGSDKQVAEALQHTSRGKGSRGRGDADNKDIKRVGRDGGSGGGGGGGGGGGATVTASIDAPAVSGPVTEAFDPRRAGDGGDGGGTPLQPEHHTTASQVSTAGTSDVAAAQGGQDILRRVLGMRIQDERLRALSAGSDERTQVEKLAWCRSQMERASKEHTSTVAALRVESKKLAEIQSKLTAYAQRRRMAAFAEPADLTRVVEGDAHLAAVVREAATEQSQLEAAAALGSVGTLARGVSHLSPEETAPLRNLARDTLEQSYRHERLEIDHPTGRLGFGGGIGTVATDATSGDMVSHMAALAQQIALGAAAAKAKDEAEEAVVRAMRDRQQAAVNAIQRKVSAHDAEVKGWRRQTARVMWRLGYARARIKTAATRAQTFERARDREDAAASKKAAAADWAREAGAGVGEREEMAAEVANAVLPAGRLLRFVVAAFVGVGAGVGVLLCAYDALGSGAAAAASAVAAAGTLGLEQGRAVRAESEQRRVARELPGAAALVTAQHAAAASGCETVAVEPVVRQVTDEIMAKNKGKELDVLKQLSAHVASLNDKYEDLSPLRVKAAKGMSSEEAMEELKALLNKELMMVQRVVVNSWEQTKVDLEAHGTKNTEGIEKLVKDESAGITALVTSKLDATGDKLDATGPKVRDAIVELVKSQLNDMRTDVAVSWSSIVQAVKQVQQGLESLDGAQRDMRSEVSVSWSTIVQSLLQLKNDVGVSWGSIAQAVRQMEKTLVDSDHGPELQTKLTAIDEKVQAIEAAQSEIKNTQSEMKSDVGVSWASIAQAMRQMEASLTASDHGTELKAEMKAIAEKVEAMQTAQSEMKSDVGVSWASIAQAVRQMEASLTASDHGTELQAKLTAIAEKVEAMQTAQSEMKSDVGVRQTEASSSVASDNVAVSTELKAVREMQETIALSQRSAEEKLSAISALDSVVAKVETMTATTETMRTEIAVSWSTIVQAVRQIRQSLSENRDVTPPRGDANGARMAELSQETLDAIAASVEKVVEMRPPAQHPPHEAPSLPGVIQAMDNPYFDNQNSQVMEAVAELKEALTAIAARIGSGQAEGEPFSITAALDDRAREALAGDLKRELNAAMGEIKSALAVNTSGEAKPSSVPPTVVHSPSSASPTGKNAEDVAEARAALAATQAAAAASDAIQPALERLERAAASLDQMEQAAAAASAAGSGLGEGVSKLGSMLDDMKRFLDNAAVAPLRSEEGPSRIEIAFEKKLEMVSHMFQELQMSKEERDQRQKSARLLSTFLWRKVREKVHVQSFLDVLLEYEGEPTTEVQIKVDRHFESVYKISSTIPTHDAKTGRKLSTEERVRMWKNSKLGLVRQLAANDRKAGNTKIPLEVTERNMMSVIKLMRPAARAKAEMSLGLNTIGEDFKEGLQRVADACEVYGVKLGAEGVTVDNVFSAIERLPEEAQEGAMKALTSKKLGGASSRVMVREDLFRQTITKPGPKMTKSLKLPTGMASPELSPSSSPSSSVSLKRPMSAASPLSSTSSLTPRRR